MGKPEPPPPPDYTPFIQASQNAAASDAEAAKINAEIAREQMAQQNVYAGRAADLGDVYAKMAQDQAAYGKSQYEDIKPFLQQYMEEQSGFQTAATKNQEAQTAAAAESQRLAALDQQRAQETYDRYKGTFIPKEDQFVQESFDYGSPARQEAAAGAAQADVAGAFQAQRDAAGRQLASYGIDPTQGRYTGAMNALDISRAASQAAAGTMARKQTEAQGKQYEAAAIEVGQKLPAQAIAQAGLGYQGAGLGTQQATAGLAGAGVGGAGITAGSGLLTSGTTAMGSPTSYAALNPYSNLTGVYGQQASSLYGTQASNLGNVSGAIGAGSGAMNNMYGNAMESYKAEAANSPWGAIGKIAGMGIPFIPGFGASDRRVKQDIRQVGTLDNGLPVYAFRFLGSDMTVIGLMADDVEHVHPEAVVSIMGLKHVNYALAVQPETADG